MTEMSKEEKKHGAMKSQTNELFLQLVKEGMTKEELQRNILELVTTSALACVDISTVLINGEGNEQ